MTNDSHVLADAVSPDHDAGRDARWLLEGRLGHTRPASPGGLRYWVLALWATGSYGRVVRHRVDFCGGAIRLARRVHAAANGVQFEHRARIRDLPLRWARKSGSVGTRAATHASWANPGAPPERPDVCVLAFPAAALTPVYPILGSWLVRAPILLLTLTFAGVFYGYLRLGSSKSVWPPTLAHVVINTSFEWLALFTATASPLALELLVGERGLLTLAATGLAAGSFSTACDSGLAHWMNSCQQACKPVRS